MSDYIIIDACNTVFETVCKPSFEGITSVRSLIKRGFISITEAEEAFVDEMLRTKYVNEENIRIRLVVDSSSKRDHGRRDYHYVAKNKERSISVDVTGDADTFILSLLSPQSVLFNYYPGDNIYVVTNDRKLTEKVYKQINRTPEHQRPSVRVYKVPRRDDENPIIPIVIDILAVKERGLKHLRYH